MELLPPCTLFVILLAGGSLPRNIVSREVSGKVSRARLGK